MSLMRDLRYALRKSVRDPGLTLILLLLLAIGIGTATIVFSLYNTVLLRPLPADEPDRLMAIYTSGSSGKPYSSNSYPDFVDVRDNNRVFSQMLAYQTRTVSMTHADGTERVDAEFVTGSYFEVLGIETVRGRAFGTADVSGPGSAPLAVLGYDYWQRRFSGADQILGDTIKLNGHTFTVVGVAPPGFRGIELPTSPGVFLPMAMADQVLGGELLANRGSRWIDVVGRLAPGVDREQAGERIADLFARISAAHPETNEDRRMSVLPVQEAMIFPPDREETLDLFSLLLGSVLIFLAAVVTNVSSILLARALARQREMALNLSLGAGRRDMLRQHLVESVAIALAAGILALPLVVWALRLLSRIDLPISYPLRLEFTPDWRVFAFAVVLSLGLGGLLGLLPALRGMRFDLVSQLKEESRGGTSRRSALWGGLVVVQIAAVLVLLVTAGLFVRSLEKTTSVDSGFETDRVLLASLDLSHRLGDEEPAGLFRQLVDEVAAVRGVEAVSLSMDRPLAAGGRRAAVWVAGVSGDSEDLPEMGLNLVSPGYFDLVGVPLVAGRDFDLRDGPESSRVAIVSRKMAARFWPGSSPVGASLRVGGPAGEEMQVVGVVEDVKSRNLRDETEPMFYTPLAQHGATEVNLLVRTAGDPEQVVTPLRRRLVSFDPDLPIFDVRTLRAQVDQSVGGERVAAATMSALGLLSLVVGVFGVFGVFAYTVHRRHREFGVRMSLGAGRPEIVRLVLRHAVVLTALGVALGLAGAIGAGFLVESHLFGVRALDPVTFIVVPLLLAATVLLASLPPILKAASVDPHSALRAD